MKKYKRIMKRKIGESRKTQSIYDNLGHPFELDEVIVIFIGNEEKAYSLTKGKKYKIIGSAKDGSFNYDKDLAKRCQNKKEKNYEASQGEDYFIIIINDKGHKRKYSHLMFKLEKVREVNERGTGK